MPIFSAAAAVGSAVLGAFGITAVGVTFATVAVGFLTQAALGFALNALAPKPKLPNISGFGSGSTRNRGYIVNQRGSALDHQIIYGRARVGGAIVHVSSNGAENKYLYQAVAYAGHEIESFDEIYINDAKVTGFDTVTLYEYNISPTIVAPLEPRYKARSTHLIEPGIYTDFTSPTLTEVVNALGLSGDPFPNGGIAVIDRNNVFQGNVSEVELPDGTKSDRYNGFIRINQHLGSPDQLADNDLVTEVAGWTADHRLRGVAYLANIFVFDQDVFPNGVPQITATIKGKKVYDPNSGTTYWSDNPALCLRDYLTSDYGLAESAQNIDDDLVISAAGICNQLSTVNNEKLYTCNGAFTTDNTPYDAVNDILTSMGGLLWYAQGKWRMKPATWVAPTVTFTEDDLRSSIAVKTRHSRRDNFNIIRGTFRGPESDWQITDYPEVSNAAFLAADNGQESVADLELPFTDNSVEARRIARIALERNRQQLTVSASFGLRGFQAQVGDVVNLSIERFGWSEKPFEVSSWTFGLTDEKDLQVQMTLREISESVFDEIDDGVIYERDNTNLLNPFIGVAPNNLTVADGGFTTEDGTFVNSFIVDWDAPDDAFADYYVLEWRAQGEFKFKSVNLRSTEYQIAPVVENTTYEIRVKAVNTLGVSGPYATVTATVGGDVTAPGLPTAVTATGGFKYITIDWTNPADADLNYIEVWENGTDTTSGATLVGETYGNQFVRTNLGISETKYYFLRAVDYSGNTSGYTAGVSATTTFIDDPDFENGIRSLFEEQGLYPIEDVDGLPASGILNRKVFNRQDGKLYEWDGSAWVLVVSAVEAPDISGQLATNQIALDAITNDLIANDAVQAENIQNLAVNADKIAANAVTATKIANAAVEEAKLADGAATEAKIATNAITETKISDNAITTPKISAGAVTAGEIAAGSIVTSKIAAGAVTANEIAAGSITSNEIATNTITAGNISAGTITSSEIATGTITATNIAADAITTSKIAAGAVTANEIAANSITSAKIAANTITANDIATGTITASEISGNTITGDKIVANTITGGLLATSGIITSSAQIDDALITNAKIDNLAVSTIKVQDGAISRNAVASGEYSASASITIIEDGWVTVIATFTQGAGKNGHTWRLNIAGTEVQTESPIEGTTGAMTSGLFLTAGTHTCTISNDVLSGDGGCGITVFGLMK